MHSFDVVFTGYGFGAAMATIAGARYAARNSQLRISCHVFGASKVGNDGFRQFFHALPNLRAFRIEGHDVGTLPPHGREWLPVGHVVQVCASADGVTFRAQRFNKPATSGHHKVKLFGARPIKMPWYVGRLTVSDAWFEEFCDVQGQGVIVDEEKRNLA